ncbi:MAG: photosystem II stability/assembly factor-like uncharacterized protein [Mariniblastus sp.]|jgi:photosystem II stability/assembly factor-like uncharacterized protein
MRFLPLLLTVIFLTICVPAVSQQPKLQQPNSPLVDSFESYQQMKRETLFGLGWISLGPVVNSARVESVQLDPSKPGTIYSAFGSGNLWKTTNNGVTWRPIFENQASHGIGDIALAPSDPNVIYLGSGESLKKARNFTIPGTGVYRSDDGGENWRHLGLADSWHIGEIAVHPQNPDIAMVAVLGHFWSSNPNRGLYRTEDGGTSWQHVLKINEHTGANDVVWSHNDPTTVYASMWENHPGVSGKNSSVYKSNDGGVNWEKSSLGLPTGDQVGRIGLAVSHSNSNKVYALVDNREFSESGGAAEVFKSLDGGAHWTRTHRMDLPFLSRIGWYFADIYVNPQDDEEIYGLGVRVAHSTNGGETFEYLGGKISHVTPSAASGLHLDHCELWINPSNPQHLVLGNDGGLYQSFDKGKSWVHFNNLPTGEFYDLELDQETPYRIFAGAQDDASVFGPAKEWDPTGTDAWKYLWIDPWNGGDGCLTLVDPSDSNTVYFSAQEGAFRRKNMTTQRSKAIRPSLPQEHPGKLKFNFVAPMIISPHESNTLYLAGNYVFKSTNRGDQWSLVSPDLNSIEEKQQTEKRISLAAATLAESPRVAGLIYLGTDKGTVLISETGGEPWLDRTQQLPAGYVRSICPSKFSDSRAYLAITGLNYDDFQSHLYCTEDRGGTWSSISANLPNEPANVILEDPVHPNILYVGTYRGVFISTNRGQTWSMLGKNLPACSVADLAFQEREKDLVIATHGRGIYKLNMAPIHELQTLQPTSRQDTLLFPIPVAKRPYLSDTRPGLNFRGVEKTPITYWLNEPGEVKISIWQSGSLPMPKTPTNSGDPSEVNEKALKTFSLAGKQGLNQIRWDLVVKSNSSLQPYFINYENYLAVGKYRVRIETQNGVIKHEDLQVIDAPNPN